MVQKAGISTYTLQFKASVWAVINEQPLEDMSELAETTADETIRR